MEGHSTTGHRHDREGIAGTGGGGVPGPHLVLESGCARERVTKGMREAGAGSHLANSCEA